MARESFWSKTALACLPKRGLTEAMYWFSRRELPPATMAALIRAYVRHYNISLDEVDGAIESFKTLNAFFTRRLKAGARPIDTAPDALLSPSDGVWAAVGPIEDLTLTQIKGKTYTLPELLGSDEEAERFRGGSFFTIYLSPRDYHRVHAPCKGELAALRHLPGALYPVNERAVKNVPRLFARNERLVLSLETDGGPLTLVMVAATCVSTITATIDPQGGRFARGEREERRPNPPVAFEAAAELGVFNMGSTVVGLLPKDAVTYVPRREGMPIEQGERFATWLSAR